MTRHRLAYAAACALAAFAYCSQAVAQDTSPARAVEWRVATRVLPPFVVKTDSTLNGFSVDLWRAIARESGARSTFAVLDSLPAMLDAVKDKRADLAISAISITAEREQQFDFSVPMFEAGLQIAVPTETQDALLGVLAGFFTSPPLYEFIALLVLLTLIPAHLVWWFERRHDGGIITPKGYVRGIGTAIWWSASTLGGQAEEMPRSGLARVVALLWIFSTIVLTSSFIAVVTTTMTVDRLKGDIAGPHDLPGRRVATVAGSTSEDFLRSHDIDAVGFPDIEQAYAALDGRRVHAVVYDSPVLQYYASHEGRDRLRLVGAIFRKESYGILFSSNDPRRKQVNAALLRLRERGDYDRLYQRWFGNTSETK